MACSITITSVLGLVPPGGTHPFSIHVTGNASGCPSNTLTVTLSCGAVLTATANVTAGGTWTAIFNSIPANCQCGDLCKIEAKCDGDSSCVQSFEFTLKCNAAPPPPCQSEVSLSATVDGCVGLGSTAVVTFTVTMTPPISGCTFTWRFGDGSPLVTTTVPTVTHVYTASGTFNAQVDISCPLAGGGTCFSLARTQVEVPPCGGCPSVTGLSATVSGCAGPAASSVSFSGTLTPAVPGCTFLWAFGDGATQVTTIPSVTHLYAAPGTYAVAVTALCPNIPPCTTTTISVEVLRCCPIVTDISANVEDDECANGAGTSATMIFSAITDPTPASGSYTWSFGDGTPQVTNSGQNATHQYAAPGSFTVTVVYVASPATHPGCSPVTFTKAGIVVPSCGPGGPGDDDDEEEDEGGWCFAGRAVVVIAAVIAAIAGLLALCVPAAAAALGWIAFGAALAALIVGIFWGIFCPKPCNWGLLFAWQVSMGVGFVALYFTNCCPTLWAVGIPALGLGISGALWWKQLCNKSDCQLIKEISIALVGVVIPILGWLGVIPGLAMCTNTIIAAGLSTLAAAVAVKLAACVP